MMKRVVGGILYLVLCLWGVGTATASVPSYDGPYGPPMYSNQPTEAELEALYSADMELLAKYEASKGWATNVNGAFALYVGPDKTSGKWFYWGGKISGYGGLYVAVGAASWWKVYKFESFDFTSGAVVEWDTLGLFNGNAKKDGNNPKKVSEISFWGVNPHESVHAPLPGSALLMVSALAGVALMRAHRRG